MDRLLIVDDDVGWITAISKEIESVGYAIRILSRAGDLAKSIDEWSPSVLLLDIVMPDKDGIEVLSELSKLGFSGRIILISQSNEIYLRIAWDLAKAYGLNAVATMKKPLAADQLAAVLQGDRPIS